jgi:two-component system, sensor histidine kinase and response regulator
VMDGFTATTALRRREAGGKRLPVIALTADATPAGRNACLAAGMDAYLAKPFSREALHATLARWLPLAAEPAAASVSKPAEPEPDGPLLDRGTLNALRALPRRGSKDMLSHIVDTYLTTSRELITTIERCIDSGEADNLARAAHAWRSCNGNVGAHGLARLCRELEDDARQGTLSGARELFVRIRCLYDRVRDELRFEMRRSA